MAVVNVNVSNADMTVLGMILGAKETPVDYIQRNVTDNIVKPLVVEFRRTQMIRVMQGLNTTSLADFKTILGELETVMRNHGLLT